MIPKDPDILEEFLEFVDLESSWVTEMGGQDFGIEYVVALSKIAGAAELIKRLQKGADEWAENTTSLNTN